MQPVSVPMPDMSDEGIRAATGKTWAEWFAVMDAHGGPGAGRRELGQLLYATHKVDPWWYSTLLIEYEAHHGLCEKDGRPKGYQICATKTMNVSAARAYEACTQAAQLCRWFGEGSEIQASVGGRYSNADGDTGTVKKLRPEKEIALTWENPRHTPGTTVSITFPPKGDERCTVTVTHDRIQTRAEADELRATWLAALERMKAWLESE